MNIINNRLLKRIYQKLTGVYYNISYSQTGEDLIIEFLINARGITNFTYLDIGANHPVKFNNSYKFYELGYRGVCIEPDPYLFKVLSGTRPGDRCINVGIAGDPSTSSDFYIMSDPALNTFSKAEAENYKNDHQYKIKEVIKVPLFTVEQIIKTHFSGRAPVFINLDVEGLDEEILRTFPFDQFRPFIFCIETVHFSNNASSEKRREIIDLMSANNYTPFADTYLNTIFIDNKI